MAEEYTMGADATPTQELTAEEQLTIRKSDLFVGLKFEHEIYDWLWMGATVGRAFNLRHFVSKPGDGRRDALFVLDANDAPFTQFSLFVVPPKKFYK